MVRESSATAVRTRRCNAIDANHSDAHVEQFALVFVTAGGDLCFPHFCVSAASNLAPSRWH